MPRKDKDRPLTPEEKVLWEAFAQETKPIKKRERSVPKKPGKAIRIQPDSTQLPQLSKTLRHLPSLEHGQYVSIDRNLKERFRKGELEIDGQLDLHGNIREQARKKVIAFISRHIQSGSRCLIIVTGKGMHKSEEDNERGVLRDMLPAWLNEEELRPYILAFDTAKAHHGGRGAFYVLLRRKR